MAHKGFDNWVSHEHAQYVKLVQSILTAKQIIAPFLEVLYTIPVSAAYLTCLMTVAQSWWKSRPFEMGFLSPLYSHTSNM